MKAVRVHEWGAPPRLDDVAEPARPADHTLVRVAAASVGHLDRTIWRGGFLRHPPLPYVPGVEAAGEVVASDVFSAGDRVWLRGGGLGTTTNGTWSELVVAPNSVVGKLPSNVSFELGAVFFSPCTSAWVSLHDVASVQPGESVLISGATGAVGSVAVQLALELGAVVTAVVTSANAQARLPAGVRPLVAGNDIDHRDLAADVLIDPVGGAVLEALLPLVRPGGRVVAVGYVAGSTLELDLPTFVQRDVSLLPLNMINRESQGRSAVPGLLERLGAGRLSMPVTEFALSDAAGALSWLELRGRTGRAAIRVGV